MTAYVSKEILQRLRSYENEDFQFNRAVSDEFLAEMDPEIRLPVLESFSHKQYDGPYADVIRCVVAGAPTIDGPVEQLFVDMPIDEFLALPVSDVDLDDCRVDVVNGEGDAE